MSNFYCFLVLATTMALGCSSHGLFTIWLALELNMLSFLLMIYLDENLTMKPSTMKYFIIQAYSSSLMLWCAMLGPQQSSSLLAYLFVGFLLMKLGVPPFHNWILAMSQTLSWEMLYLLLSIQKILPAFLLSQYASKPALFVAVVLSGSSGLLILNEVVLKRMMTLSGALNMGWMLLSITSSKLFFYFVVFYFLVTFALFSALSSASMDSVFGPSLLMAPMYVFCLSLILATLGGVPPLMGFWVKAALLTEVLFHTKSALLCLFMLTMSLFSLKMYLALVETLLPQGAGTSFKVLASNSMTPIIPAVSMLIIPLILLT